MTENLTRSLNLACNAPDCSPIPSHDLVIFKKIGSVGLEFREVVPVGKRFRKKFWDRGNFEAFAVKRHENLNYAFSHPVKHIDPKHHFIMHFRLYYEVTDPRRVVEKLESDPLKELKVQAVTLLGHTARHLDWEIVVNESEFERSILEYETPSEEGIEFSNLERLRQIASATGLNVKSISIQRSLPKEEDVAKTNYDESLDHLLALERQSRHVELTREERFDEEITEVGVHAIGKMRDPSNAVEGFRVVEDLHKMKGESKKKLIGAGASSRSPSADSSPRAITRGNGIAGTLAAEILERMPSLGTGSPAERQLTSSMLHLIAELSLGRDADDGRLKDHAAAITPLLRELYDKLSPAQLDLIHRLQEPLSRKKEISEATL
jgi:regulator of protease activity HflC (stomatin/prohibitin superfamily)